MEGWLFKLFFNYELSFSFFHTQNNVLFGVGYKQEGINLSQSDVRPTDTEFFS